VNSLDLTPVLQRVEKERGTKKVISENPDLYPLTATDPLTDREKLVYATILGTALTSVVVKWASGLSEERTEATLHALERSGLARSTVANGTTYYSAVWDNRVREQLPELVGWLLANDYITH